MNPVEQFFKSEKWNASKLASSVGVSPSTVCRMLSGERDASPDLARKIEAATEGKLSALDFLSACMQARVYRELQIADKQHIRSSHASPDRKVA